VLLGSWWFASDVLWPVLPRELTAAIGLVWSSASACLAVVCIHYHRDDQLRAVNEACMMQERTVCQRKYVS
jgi:hypothetical protein